MTPRKRELEALWQPLHANNPGNGRRRPAEENPALETMWHVVCEIPWGQVTTYGAVARAAGLPGRARQAGLALKLAPEDMNLPWHRVVAAGGRIAFPKTSRHHREQARRLRAEGVVVHNGRVARAAMTELEDL